MEVNGQLYAPAPMFPGEEIPVPRTCPDMVGGGGPVTLTENEPWSSSPQPCHYTSPAALAHVKKKRLFIHVYMVGKSICISKYICRCYSHL